jgi:hypothetical protein
MRFLFVGERPSHQAVKIGATWQNGKLAAKQLHDALRALNIDPDAHQYINLWTQPDPGAWDKVDEMQAIERIGRHIDGGYTVVGMGKIVSAALARYNITHLQIIHPAAQGAIRKKARYTAHVGFVLNPLLPVCKERD